MSSMPQLPAAARIAGCNLTDQELAFIAALIKMAGDERLDAPVGWTQFGIQPICLAICDAARLRGIADGCKAITQTVDLRV